MKMKLINILLGCLGLMAMQQQAAAQTISNLDQVMTEMKKVQAFYKGHPLSFAVKYTYANEHVPGKALDSLQGKIEMSGAGYRCWLDSTETIHNDRYNIILFKEDKLMYLTKPAAGMTGTDPLQLLRTTLERTGVKSCGISGEGHNRTVQVVFSEGMPYRQMEMTIDTLSGRLLSMQYIIKTALLMEVPDNEEAARQGYEKYAVVKASFSQYRPLPADPSRFDEHTFFSKEGTVLKTTEAYKEYKLIVGSPNL